MGLFNWGNKEETLSQAFLSGRVKLATYEDVDKWSRGGKDYWDAELLAESLESLTEEERYVAHQYALVDIASCLRDDSCLGKVRYNIPLELRRSDSLLDYSCVDVAKVFGGDVNDLKYKAAYIEAYENIVGSDIGLRANDCNCLEELNCIRSASDYTSSIAGRLDDYMDNNTYDVYEGQYWTEEQLEEIKNDFEASQANLKKTIEEADEDSNLMVKVPNHSLYDFRYCGQWVHVKILKEKRLREFCPLHIPSTSIGTYE